MLLFFSSEKECITPPKKGECFKHFDRFDCLSNISSRGSPFDGICIWCPDGPCHDRNNNRCEPKNWLISENLLKPEFEECPEYKGILYLIQHQ